jgi:integrase
MRAILCKSLIDKLTPTSKPYEVRDTKTPGLLLRVQPTGVMTYYLQIGRGKRIKIGRGFLSIDDVREIVLDHLAALSKGKDPARIQAQTSGHTFLNFVELEFAPWATVHLKAAPELLRRLRSNCKRFHRRRLIDVSARTYEEWRFARLQKGKSPNTVNRDLDDLRSVLSKALLWGYITTNPLAYVRKLKNERARVLRYLSDTEEMRLFDQLNSRELRVRQARQRTNIWRLARGYSLLPTLHNLVYADYLRPMVTLALNTGMRRTEIFDLRWQDVDMERKFLTVRGENAKSCQTRHIPLNKVCLKVLLDWNNQCPDGAELVFPAKDGARLRTVNTAWRAVLAKAEISQFRWHDLRHTFAFRLVMKGVDLNTVRELLGHADCKMTVRYAHLAPEYKAEAVARLAA